MCNIVISTNHGCLEIITQSQLQKVWSSCFKGSHRFLLIPTIFPLNLFIVFIISIFDVHSFVDSIYCMILTPILCCTIHWFSFLSNLIRQTSMGNLFSMRGFLDDVSPVANDLDLRLSLIVSSRFVICVVSATFFASLVTN